MYRANPSSMRVLIRPQSTTNSSSPSLHPTPIPPPNPPPPGSSNHGLSDESVVVGFIGRKRQDVSQLMNRILDSNVFGSGNLDKELRFEQEGGLGEEMKNWFKFHKISYYRDEEKGLLFLQFSSAMMGTEGFLEFSSGLDSAVEEWEFGHLQGMLFMFSVCHIIIYIQEGSRFDTQVLKRLRLLQVAKHSLAPFGRLQTIQSNTSTPNFSASSRPTLSTASSKNPPIGRKHGIINRNSSANSLMSGLGSYTSLFPGQCTPVTLFVFLENFSDIPNTISKVEDSTDATIARPSSIKGSGPVVVLARPVSKPEGELRKKLQSSLEAQVRFLIKKCRILNGSDSTHSGSRNGAVSNSAPLFSLDTSKAVVLLDKCANQGGKSLDFANSLVEEFLNGKITSDTLLLESHSQYANKEDLLSVKEFIYKQSDILRGKGGSVNSASSNSAAGVGMVAVAAAAAAASVASGKVFSAPELPSLETWISFSQLILREILVAKHKDIMGNSLPLQQVDGITLRVSDHLDVAVSLLENSKGLNAKFSTLWCEKAIPVAREVYLRDSPTCYPTSLHEAHLKQALQVFHSMVKGPAVQTYAKQLEAECTIIWKSGRQLCDSISLTGNPCMHQRHDYNVKPHCSGFVFLHACACGRSRKLRCDPFDFETANVTFSCFPDCDELLPFLQLPEVGRVGPIQASSWSLIRVGGARYYEPSKGLVQSGFLSSQKFLSKWTIFLEKQRNPNDSSPRDFESDISSDINTKMGGELQIGTESKISSSVKNDDLVDDKKVSFGKDFTNFTLRRPFSEVVAGSAATDSEYPPLQLKRRPILGSEKGFKQNDLKYKNSEKIHLANGHENSQKAEVLFPVSETSSANFSNGYTVTDPFLWIGSNIVPVNMNAGGKIKSSTSPKHVTMYVGFEHECPHGHRFILTPESYVPSLGEKVDSKVMGPRNIVKNGGHGKVYGHSNKSGNATPSKMRNLEKPKVNVTRSDVDEDGLEESFRSMSINGGSGIPLLNSNIPIYMNCPHCRNWKKKKNLPMTKFSGTVSQLQRIFLVTPPFPVVLATSPVIQFEKNCLSQSVVDREKKLQFSLGSQVILPPESFVTLRLPFMYGVQLEDGCLHPLKPFEHQPELTAWLNTGTALQVVSKEKTHLDE